ncbi:MAG: DUF5009 domain-containing protein [Cytophagales bacterium]|nr:DUF5009 domain-containing protein [Cytophagales bacterium]
MQNQRIVSIDIFRALTMFMMIFVNDFWTLYDIPEWLGHAKADEDRMGLSDWVFPGFLFIVGLSIPFAIQARRNKGASGLQIFRHIVKRSFALVAMGFFMVNLENINVEMLPVSKFVWQLLMAFSIVLIWNIYPDKKAFKRIPERGLQLAGILILVFLGIIYKGGTPEDPEWLRPHWWGILGIIGWAYFLCATIFLILGKKIVPFILVVLVFQLMNAMEFGAVAGARLPFILVVSASNHATVASGILVTLLYMKYGKRNQIGSFVGLLAGFGAISVLYALITRPEWGISKIRATPSWTSICIGISTASFMVLYGVSDLLNKTSWANFIKPAGRSTLTCYLVPYFYYPVIALAGVSLPDELKTGAIGIVKSLAFAYLMIYITGVMERLNIRLKV